MFHLNLNDLPEFILIEVLNLLKEDNASLALVCKSFRQIFLNLKIKYNPTLSSIIKFPVHHFHILTLELSQMILDLKCSFSQLKGLKIVFYHNPINLDDVITFIRNHPQLKDLDMISFKQESILSQAQWLRLLPEIINLNQLTRISLFNMLNTTEALTLIQNVNSSNLKKFDLSVVGNIYEILDSISIHFTNLEQLDLSGYFYTHVDGFKGIDNPFTELKTLSLKVSKMKLNPDQMSLLPSNFPKLERVFIKLVGNHFAQLYLQAQEKDLWIKLIQFISYTFDPTELNELDKFNKLQCLNLIIRNCISLSSTLPNLAFLTHLSQLSLTIMKGQDPLLLSSLLKGLPLLKDLTLIGTITKDLVRESPFDFKLIKFKLKLLNYKLEDEILQFILYHNPTLQYLAIEECFGDLDSIDLNQVDLKLVKKLQFHLLYCTAQDYFDLIEVMPSLMWVDFVPSNLPIYQERETLVTYKAHSNHQSRNIHFYHIKEL